MKFLHIKRWQFICALVMLALTLTACQPIRPEVGAGAANAQETPNAKPPTEETPIAENAAAADQSTTSLAEGQAFFLKSDLAGAEKVFRAAVKADPNDLQALFGLTDVHLFQPQYHQQALESAEAALKLAPDDPAALARLSWALQGKHRFEEARKTAEKAVEVGPNSALAHIALADIQSAMYEFDAAYQSAQKAVELDENSANGWTTLGSIAFELEKWSEAGKAYDRAVEAEPDFFLWRIFQARYEFDTTGDLAAANEIAESAVKTQPNHPYVLSFLVDMTVEKNDWKSAEATCQQSIKLNTPATVYPDGYVCMANILMLEERSDEAKKYQDQAEELAWPERRDISVTRMRLLNDDEQCSDSRKLAEAWLEERPYSVAAMRMVGVSYLCSEEYEKAIDFFKQAVAKLPLSLGDARLLANAYARDGKEREATSALRKFNATSTSNPLYYQALYEVYLYLSKPKEAVKQAQRWQVLRPESLDARVSLALAFLFDDNVQAAQNAAEEAIDGGASDSTVYAILGETYHRQGDLEKGEEYLRKALERNPNNFLAHNYLVSLYLGQGDCEKALPLLEWLEKKTSDEAQLEQLRQLIQACQSGGLPGPGDDESGGQPGDGQSSQGGSDPSALDRATTATVRAFLRDSDVRIRTVRFEESDGAKTLLVGYSTRIEADSEEFRVLERKIAYGIASLLPDMEAKPDAVAILSASNDKPQRYIVISSKAAALWMDGQLTDQEFEDSWKVEQAE